MSEIQLPKYDRPPVVETVLGIQFDPLAKLSNPYLGAFWESIRGNGWPTVSEAPALEPQLEQFTESEKWGKAGVRIKLSQQLAIRLQIKNEAGDRMMQVQNGRVHFNWLDEGGAYPQYENVRGDFLQTLDLFKSFVAKEGLGEIRPTQWEVTYVNHIPHSTVWREAAEWNFFRPLNPIDRIGELDRLESFSGEWHFVILENAGRLHVQWQHGVKSADKEKGVEVIRLTLTARGPLALRDAAHAGILDGLNLGHETIVRAFEKLMSDQANDYWGLKHATS